jgi:hypothetical protein
MPVGAQLHGEDWIFQAATNTGTEAAPDDTGATYAPISGKTTFNWQAQRQSTDYGAFGRATAIRRFGNRVVSLTLSGELSGGDSGEQIIIDAEEANEIFFLKVLVDGTNGTKGPIRAGTRGGNVTNETVAQSSYDLGAAGNAVLVGTGPKLW